MSRACGNKGIGSFKLMCFAKKTHFQFHFPAMVNIGLQTKRREARQTGLCQGLTNCTPECKEKKGRR